MQGWAERKEAVERYKFVTREEEAKVPSLGDIPSAWLPGTKSGSDVYKESVQAGEKERSSVNKGGESEKSREVALRVGQSVCNVAVVLV